MTKYVLRRLLGAVPLVLGIATIIFFLVNLAPGDPTILMISPGMTQEIIEQMRANFGLDQPVYIRYVKWIGEENAWSYRAAMRLLPGEVPTGRESLDRR